MGAPSNSAGALAERRSQRRARILAAGVELFTTQGYLDTITAHLCSHAGVSLRNFYEEFENKEAVLLTLHDSINATAYERIRAALTASTRTDLGSRMSILFDNFFASVTADPRIPRLNYVEAIGVSPAMERQHRSWVVRWADLIEEQAELAAAQGDIPGRRYRHSAIGIVGAVTYLVRDWQYTQADVPVAEVTAAAWELAVAILSRVSDRQSSAPATSGP